MAQTIQYHLPKLAPGCLRVLPALAPSSFPELFTHRLPYLSLAAFHVPRPPLLILQIKQPVASHTSGLPTPHSTLHTHTHPTHHPGSWAP